MKQLLKFELKKILNKKSSLIAMALGLLLIIVSNISLIRQSSLYLGGENNLEGVSAIKKQTEIENSLTSELSDEFMTKFLKDYQLQLKNNPNEDYFSLIAPKSNLFSLIAGNYTEANADWSWEDLNKIDTKNDIGFYERRIEKIDNLLNFEYSYGNFTQIEKEYWLQKAKSVNTPFKWGSKITWDKIWNSITLLIYLLFVIAICIAPVFAGEYQNRTDALLLSTKHGKNKLITAKIMASFIFTFVYVLLCSVVSIGINVAILGTDGWNLPVQLWDTSIPYHYTAIEICGINLLIIFLISFLLTAISLLLSSTNGNPMIVLAVDIILFFGTIFIPFSKSSRLWNRILYLLPIHSFNLQNVLKTYNSYQFGDVVIPYLSMIFIVYVLITVICIFLTRRSFKKHQIGK